MCTVPLWLNILSRELEEVMEPLWAIPSTPPLIPEPVRRRSPGKPMVSEVYSLLYEFLLQDFGFLLYIKFYFFCFILKNTSEINKNTTHQRAINSRVKKKIYFLYLSLLFVSVLLCVLFLPCFKRGCFYDNNLEHPSLFETLGEYHCWVSRQHFLLTAAAHWREESWLGWTLSEGGFLHSSWHRGDPRFP